MSVNASFTLIDQALWVAMQKQTAADSNNITNFYPPGDLWSSLSGECLLSGFRAWWVIHNVLYRFGEPLSWAINGDLYPFDGLKVGINEPIAFSGDYYLAFVSAEHVVAISHALETLTFPNFLAQVRPEEIYPENYMCEDFKHLCSIYRKAASMGQAIFITIV